MFVYFLVGLIKSLEITINDKPKVTADTIADAVKASNVNATDVISISVSSGELKAIEFISEGTTIMKTYPKLKTFVMTGDSSIELNTLPGKCFWKSGIEKVQINNVQIIGREAFYNCTKLTSFEATTVVDIKIGAFRFCRTLDNLAFPNAKYVRNYAFMNCSSLVKISLPVAERVEDDAFCNNFKLETISLPKVTHIGTECFRETGLITIDIPQNVEYIGSYAFYYCKKLTGPLTFSVLKTIKTSAFNNCSSLTEINAPSCVEIELMAFRNCSLLSKVNIPNVTKIGYEAFFSTPKLVDISIPNIESVGSWSFWKSAVTAMNSPTLKILGQQAFRDCINLTKVTIPNVKKVGLQAFDNCSSIQTADFPETTYVADYAFRNCQKLESTTFPKATLFGNSSFANAKSLKQIDAPNVEQIGNYTFQHCEKLEKAIFPKATYLGNFSFAYTKSLKEASTPLVEHIGNKAFIESAITEANYQKVKYIGDYTFQNCSSMVTAYLGDELYKIGFSIFWGCTKLVNVSILGNVDTSGSPNILQDTKLKYFKLSNRINNLNFQPDAEYEGIVSQALGYCPDVSTYNLQNHVNKIADGAFRGCSNITQINNADKIIAIGSGAFENTGFLTFDAPPKLSTIGDFVFSNCSSIENITFNCPITRIGKGVFEKCKSLKNLYVPITLQESQSTVEKSVNVVIKKFNQQISYTSLTIPAIVKTIGDNSYEGCTTLTNVSVTENVIAIGTKAFSGCTSLNDISFDDNSQLASISDYGFSNCTSLIEVTLPASIQNIGKTIFYGSDKLITIYVPDNFNSDLYNDLTDGTNAHVETYKPGGGDDGKVKEINIGSIIGIILGSIALVIAIVVIIIVWRKKRNQGYDEFVEFVSTQNSAF